MTDQKSDQPGGDGLRAKLVAFSDFLNEPPQYEELRMVRDYRHEACTRWLPLVVELIAKFDASPTRDGAEGAGELSLKNLPNLLIGIQEDLPNEDHCNVLGAAAHFLRKLTAPPNPPPKAGPSAPPKPAPDAMRISDAQLSEGIKWIDWNDALNVHDEMKQLRKAVERMFCLPLPTDCPPNLTEEICTIVDQCRNGHVIGAECAKAIYSAVAKHATLSAPVPPASYVDPDVDQAANRRYWEGRQSVPPADDPEPECAPMRFENEVDAEGFTVSARLVPVPPADEAGDKRVKLSLVIEALESAAVDAKAANIDGHKALTDIVALFKSKSPSPSGTGAAEPVAWRWRNTAAKVRKWSYIEKKIHEHPSMTLEVQPLYVIPPVRGDQEIDIDLLRVSLPRYPSSKARNIAEEAVSDMEGERHDGGVYALACWFDAVLSFPVQPGATDAKMILYTVLEKYISQEMIDGIWQDVKEAEIFSK